MTTSETSTTTVDIKPFTSIVSVKNIIFRVTPKGRLVPVLSLNENKEINKYNVNAIMFNEIDAPLEKGFLGINSRLKVKFDKNLMPDEIKVVKSGSNPIIPTDCPSCSNELKDYICSNLYCSGKSKGCLHKLMSHAGVMVYRDLYPLFFDGFATAEDTVSIDNMYDFKVIFPQIKQKETQGRLQNWISAHGTENGTKLWEMEVAVLKLISGGVRNKVFWSICNFPNIIEEDFYELSKINPVHFINGFKSEGNQFYKLNKRSQKYLVDNMDFIHLLDDVFNLYKVEQCES